MTKQNTSYIKNTHESSAKFGPCEFCGGHVSEVWLKRIGAIYVFGHRKCMQNDDQVVLKAHRDFDREHHGIGF